MFQTELRTERGHSFVETKGQQRAEKKNSPSGVIQADFFQIWTQHAKGYHFPYAVPTLCTWWIDYQKQTRNYNFWIWLQNVCKLKAIWISSSKQLYDGMMKYIFVKNLPICLFIIQLKALKMFQDFLLHCKVLNEK